MVIIYKQVASLSARNRVPADTEQSLWSLTVKCANEAQAEVPRYSNAPNGHVIFTAGATAHLENHTHWHFLLMVHMLGRLTQQRMR